MPGADALLPPGHLSGESLGEKAHASGARVTKVGEPWERTQVWQGGQPGHTESCGKGSPCPHGCLSGTSGGLTDQTTGLCWRPLCAKYPII